MVYRLYSSYTNILELPIINIFFFFLLENYAFLCKNLPNWAHRSSSMCQTLYSMCYTAIVKIHNKSTVPATTFNQISPKCRTDWAEIHIHMHSYTFSWQEFWSPSLCFSQKPFKPFSSYIFSSIDVKLLIFTLSSTNNPDRFLKYQHLSPQCIKMFECKQSQITDAANSHWINQQYSR